MRDTGLDTSITSQIIGQAMKFPEINRLLLYGSRARGDYRPSSDIDIAVDASGMDSRRFSAFWNALDDLPIIFKIDALDIARLTSEPLRQQIMTQGIPIYDKDLAHAR